MAMMIDEIAKSMSSKKLEEINIKINNSKRHLDKAREILRMLAMEITRYGVIHNFSTMMNEIEVIDNDNKDISLEEAVAIYSKRYDLYAFDIVNVIATNRALNHTYLEVEKYISKEAKAEFELKTDNQAVEKLRELDRNTEFTLSRQVLAIRYLLEETYEKYGLALSNADKTEIARLVQFLTGREPLIKEIKNTRIYKKWSSPLNSTDKAAEKDLNFVRNIFEKLGLNQVANKIDREIGSRESQ